MNGSILMCGLEQESFVGILKLTFKYAFLGRNFTEKYALFVAIVFFQFFNINFSLAQESCMFQVNFFGLLKQAIRNHLTGKRDLVTSSVLLSLKA